MQPSPLSAILTPTVQIATAPTLIPGLGAIGDLLSTIIQLYESVSRNKNAARRLVERCEQLYDSLKQYETIPIPQQTVNYRDKVFECLKTAKEVMDKWPKKGFFDTLLHQSKFQREFIECNERISDCFTVFSNVAQMQGLAYQMQDESWKSDLKDMFKELIEQMSRFFQSISRGQRIVSEEEAEEKKRMATNLYDLLKLSNQFPAGCRLDGMVESLSEVYSPGGSTVTSLYKGRYLGKEDVRIKIIHSANSKDEKTINRIEREIRLWASIHEKDQGKHVIPFYGFYTPDGHRLALVSPWMENGDVLTYVKKNMYIDYRRLIAGIAEGIKVLHSMDPPIIHGNLRAENVLIGDKGQPLITDLTFSKIDGDPATQTGGFSDKIRWTAPEMFQHEEEPVIMSRKGDIYSFGMTVLQLFTHDQPYVNLKHNTSQVYPRKMRGEIPDRPQDPDVIKRGLDEAMWSFLCVCWSRHPEDRPSIEEIIKKF